MLFIPEFPWSDLHTLNLDWLLSVVANHERQLQDIEGSSSPYDEAPLADGIADPGNVNQFARGNHRHPTDTTRASVTALQAVQDSVPGPSNGNPRMDGTANPGTYTYYSRADHVHPSDTSRASVEALNNARTALETAIAAKMDANNIYRIVKNYIITVTGTNTYTFIDNYENLEIPNSHYCVSMIMRGFSQFPGYLTHIAKGSAGTDFYLFSGNPGTYTFSVEYWMVRNPIETITR